MRYAPALFAAFAALLCAAPALAETSCPATVAVQAHAASLPDGWTARSSDAHPELVGVTIFEGPPEENASLVYDDEKKTSSEFIQTWKLPHNDRGYWLVCRYSRTTMELMRKLPDSAQLCRVVFERSRSAADGLGIVKTATCK